MMSLVLVVLLAATPTPPQSSSVPPPSTALSPEEAVLVAQAWADLADSDLEGAALRIRELQENHPRSVHLLPLQVEVSLHDGAAAGLATYEAALVDRSVDDPSILRRLAHAILSEAAVGTSEVARLKALRALADDGDRAAFASLQRAAQQGSLGDVVHLAALGHAQAAERLTEALAGPVPNKIGLVEALAEGGARTAIPAITAMLDEPRPEHRAAAARALGQLGARDQIERLRGLLKAPNQPPSVPLAAAAALLQLEDTSGLDQLRGWLGSPVPAMRLSAARALEPRADAAWLSTVRDLQDEADPMLRLDAARLLMPHDPGTARATIEQLAASSDPAVAGLALEVLAAELPADFARLRELLRQPRSRIAAAARILELTR